LPKGVKDGSNLGTVSWGGVREGIWYIGFKIQLETLLHFKQKEALGKRDHSTIMHGVEKIDNDMKQYEDIRRTIDVLKKKINPSD
jgi:hypothetical protein